MASSEEIYPIIRTARNFSAPAPAPANSAPSSSRRFRSRSAAVLFIFALLSGVVLLISSNRHVLSSVSLHSLLSLPVRLTTTEESIPTIVEAQVPTADCSGGLYCRMSLLVTTVGLTRTIEAGYIIYIPRASTVINDGTKKNVRGETDIGMKRWCNTALTQISRTYPLSELGIVAADILPALKQSRKVLLTCTSTAQESCRHRVKVKSYPDDAPLVVEALIKTNDCVSNVKLECRARLLVTISKTVQKVEAGYIIYSKKGDDDEIDKITKKNIDKVTDQDIKTWSSSAIKDVSKRFDMSIFGLTGVDVFPALKESHEKLLTCEKTSDPACTTMVIINQFETPATPSPTPTTSPSSSSVPTATPTASTTPPPTESPTPTSTPTPSPTPTTTSTATATSTPSPSPAELCPTSIEDTQCAEFYASLPMTAPTDWASLNAMMPFCGPPDFVYNTIGIKAPLCLEAAVTNREGEKCPPLVQFSKFFMKIGNACQRDCMASTVLDAYKKTYPVLKPCEELQNMEPFIMLYPTAHNSGTVMPSTCGSVETTFFYSGQVTDTSHNCDF